MILLQQQLFYKNLMLLLSDCTCLSLFLLHLPNAGYLSAGGMTPLPTAFSGKAFFRLKGKYPQILKFTMERLDLVPPRSRAGASTARLLALAEKVGAV